MYNHLNMQRIYKRQSLVKNWFDIPEKKTRKCSKQELHLRNIRPRFEHDNNDYETHNKIYMYMKIIVLTVTSR